jgi:hypothetical protein
VPPLRLIDQPGTLTSMGVLATITNVKGSLETFLGAWTENGSAVPSTNFLGWCRHAVAYRQPADTNHGGFRLEQPLHVARTEVDDPSAHTHPSDVQGRRWPRHELHHQCLGRTELGRCDTGALPDGVYVFLLRSPLRTWFSSVKRDHPARIGGIRRVAHSQRSGCRGNRVGTETPIRLPPPDDPAQVITASGPIFTACSAPP